MKAMILAAGLGTRLKPLTDTKPKALVEVAGMPLLLHSINKLKAAGVDSIIVNVHHFAQQLIDYVNSNDFGVPVTVSDETGQLLETGGGLKKAEAFFNDGKSFLVCNVDVLSGTDLQKVVEEHAASHALVTLVVKARRTARYFLFDRNLQLCGWKNTKTDEVKTAREATFYYPYAFSGIQVVRPEIFPFITEQGKFSLTALYLRLAENHQIRAYVDDAWWFDLGKYEDIGSIEEYLK